MSITATVLGLQTFKAPDGKRCRVGKTTEQRMRQVFVTQQRLSTKDVAEAYGVSVATAHNILMRMARQGTLKKDGYSSVGNKPMTMWRMDAA